MIEFLTPPGWKPGKGYAHGTATVLQPGDRIIHVAGMIGWQADQTFASDDFVDQTRQALQNIVDVLADAGAAPDDLLSLTWYITDKAECIARQDDLGRAYRDVIGRHYPAMAMVEVTALMEDRAKVEIEARAVTHG